MQANAQGGPAPGRTFERVAVVRDLAGRRVPLALVHAFGPGGAELAVLERYATSASLDATALDQLERDARATMSLRHPNVAPVRDVWREGAEVLVASEFIEGETLEELRRLGAGGKDLTIEVGVRVIVDVLAALSALHTLGAGALAHGEVTGANVIVGFDGTTRVVRPYRGRIAGRIAEVDWFSYAAPEAIKGSPADARSDLYSVGVLLWETLSRRKLFPKATREGRAARSVPVGKPSPPPDSAWAAPLGAVAERALANDPATRYTTAAEMAAAVRLAVRSKLAMPPRVATAVDKLASDRILARRTANALPEPIDPPARISAIPSRPSVPPDAMRALSAMRPSSRPPTPRPGPVTSPIVPKAPLLPQMEVRTGPRPFAPPLKLAPPTPKPPSVVPSPRISEPPISLDEAFVESASSSTIASAGMGAATIATAPPAMAQPPLGGATLPLGMKPIATSPLAFKPFGAPVAQAASAAPSPSPALAANVARGPVDPTDVPAGLGAKNGRVFWIIGAALIALVALAAIARTVLSGSSTSKTGTHTTKDDVRPSTTLTATAIPTSTPTSTSTTVTPTASAASSTPDTATSAEPDPTATTTAPETSHRPHARPRPTYDPMGI